MNLLKQSVALLFAITVSTFACWFRPGGFNYNYIAGVNNYQAHYVQSQSIDNATYLNNMYVALPITVYVKIHEDPENLTQITKAVLQYRVKRSGSWLTGWVTVKTIQNPSYNLSVNEPVALFGNGTIDPKNLQSGDEIFIRYYVTDGIIESGDLTAALNNLDCYNVEDRSTSDKGNGWTSPFILKVIYNGQRRIGW